MIFLKQAKRIEAEWNTGQCGSAITQICLPSVKKQKEIKTVGWLEQVRIPMEKDKDGKDITPAYEDFIKNGTVRRPRITTGDNLTDDIHQVGLISSRRMSAQETLETKRKHWKIENSLHYVLDDLFREDRFSARKSKNNLAVIRKIAYNLLRIAILREKNRIRSN